MTDVPPTASTPDPGQRPRLATLVVPAFDLFGAVALLALVATAFVVVLVPKSTVTRGELALELAFLGFGLGSLAMILGRHVAHELGARSRTTDVRSTHEDS